MDEFIKILIYPSGLMTWLLILAAILYLLKRRAVSAIAFLASISIYFVFGSGPISQLLLSNLEYRYPAYQQLNDEPEISTIVLLTGGAEAKPETPFSSHINSSSAYRILETRRVFLLHPEAKILVSGLGSTPDMLKQVLVSLDIPESRISLDTESPTTYESASNLVEALHGQTFILVTSAGHMPRAMASFEANNLHPVPAPTEFLSRKNIFAAQYLPSPYHMAYSDLAIHEYLGMLWYKVSGRI